MKALLVALWLLTLPLKAIDVHLVWDASVSEGVTNYIFYAHTNELNELNLSTAVFKKAVGTNVTVKLEGITGPWWFAVTCQSTNGLESTPSNIVIYIPPVKAQGPANLRATIATIGPWLNQYLTKYFRMRW